MSKNRQTCVGCNNPFPLTELHIDPNTSDWYCDPCFNMTMLERDDPAAQDTSEENWETGQEDE